MKKGDLLNSFAVILSGLVICLVSAASAAEIAKVQARTPDGNTYPVTNISPHINSQAGDVFSQKKLTEDIQRLYKTGFFRDIAADVDQTPEGNTVITFIVEPVPRIAEISIKGNKRLKKKKLRSELTVKKGDLYDAQAVAASSTAMRQLYEEKSYYGTTVKTDIKKINEKQVNVIWEISEEPRTKLRNIEFVGNTIFSKRKLLKHIRTDPTFWSYIFPVGFFSEKELKIDRIRLQNLYARKGYLDFEISEIRRDYSKKGKWVSLTVFLNEGLPYVIDDVAVEGNQLFGDAEIKRKFELKEGLVYTPVLESQDIDAIREMYAPQGYIDLTVRPRLDKDPEKQLVDVTYIIEEGPAAQIRNVRITGNNITKDEVIRRELLLQPGDKADFRKIDASRSVLKNLNYFETVSITPLSTEVPAEKDLNVQVEEKRTGQLMAGAGFSSEDALIGTLQVTQTNFDLTDWPTFRGGGQRMRLQLQMGTEQSNALVSFTEPWWLDRRLRLNASAFTTTRNEEEYDRERTGISTSLAWRGIFNLRHEAGIQIQQVELTDFSDTVSQELADEEGTYDITALQYSISRDTRDRFIYPTQGSTWELSAELQPEILGTYSDIYSLGLDATTYLRLLSPFILRLRGELGVVDSISGEDVAIFDRLFAGGTSTFRGFDRREISPVDVNDDSLGGRSLLLGTVELTYPFTESVRGSIFCDMGNVWADAYDWDPADINVSVGFGLELQLPVGPIRLDYGIPVVTQQDHLSTSGRLHFNLGYYF